MMTALMEFDFYFQSGTTSPVVDLQDAIITGIIIPSGFSGTSLTFTDADGNDDYDSSGQTALTVAAGRRYRLNPADYSHWKSVSIVSGASETNKTIKLLGRAF